MQDDPFWTDDDRDIGNLDRPVDAAKEPVKETFNSLCAPFSALVYTEPCDMTVA